MHRWRAGWTSVLFGRAVNAVAIDPLALTTAYSGTSTGLLKSTGDGRTWCAVGTTMIVNALAIDLWNPGTVYAAGIHETLLKSTDGRSGDLSL